MAGVKKQVLASVGKRDESIQEQAASSSGLLNFVKQKVFRIKPVQKASTEMRPAEPGQPGAHMWSMIRNWYYNSMKTSKDRVIKYDKFLFLDKQLAEATSALNVYADNIVSGAIGGLENYMIAIEEGMPNKKELQEEISRFETKTKIKDQVWEIARNMTRDGDFWGEIVYEKNSAGDTSIEKLKKLPVRQMYADIDEYGSFKDRDKPYKQRSQFEIDDTKGIPFDDWRIIHFKIGTDVYGVNNALFDNASQRIGRQLLWVDDSMVLARLSRAWQRFAFFVDTSGVLPAEKFDYVEKWKHLLKQTEAVNRTTGRIDYDSPPPMPDEDIFIPVEKDSPQDIKQLAGDMNISNIDDVRYFQAKFFMAVNLPKVYGGIEEGVRAKATIGQIDVQFARQVRRRQNALKPGLRKFYEYFFILLGIDPDSFKWNVVFPPLATLDEMLKWQMEALKAKIAEILVVKVGAVNTRYVQEELLKFNEEEISKWGQVMPQGFTGEEGLNFTPEMIEALKRDPLLRGMLNDMRDLVKIHQSNEEERAGKDLIGEDREVELSDRQ